MLGGVSVYGASKSAVSALTRSMAIEWAQVQHPGQRRRARPHLDAELTQVTWDHPNAVRRICAIASRCGGPATPEEVVGMVLMLCSPASSYMTGQTYHLDGGCLAGGTPWDFDTKYGALVRRLKPMQLVRWTIPSANSCILMTDEVKLKEIRCWPPGCGGTSS